jgi:hypothetical protein
VPLTSEYVAALRREIPWRLPSGWEGSLLWEPTCTSQLAAAGTVGNTQWHADVTIIRPVAGGGGVGSIVKQHVKERPIRNKTLAKVFCGRLSGLAGREYSMGAAVMFDNLGMIDGNEIGLSIELLHRVASVNHYIGH